MTRPSDDRLALLRRASEALVDAIDIRIDPCGDLKLAQLRERDAKALLAWAAELA